MDGVDEPCSPTPPTGHQHQSGHPMCYETRTSSRALDIPRGPTNGFWRSQFIDNLIDGSQFKSARAKREVTNDVTKTMLYAGLGNADLRFLTDEIEKLTSEVEKIEVASGEVDQLNPRGADPS
jgi:hypothetical protein